MKVKDAIKMLKEKDPEEVIALIIWGEADVKTVLKTNFVSKDLLKSEVHEILTNLEDSHDAEYGITWDDILYQIKEVFRCRDES